jgi:hypothetical protein
VPQQSPQQAELQRSRVPFDHYGYPVGQEVRPRPVVAACFLNLTRHIEGTAEQRTPICAILLSIMFSIVLSNHTSHTYHTCWCIQVVDAELPKGKAACARVCKQDLFEVLQRKDECKTVPELISEGKAEGDEWLSHRGRRVVPGPEMRRGRKNLFDVVHHTCAEGLQQDPTFTGAACRL